ncbi:MAG TPA: phosphoribosyltransferase [Magnetospirillaceae bacterium]|nr:phosphoribosyltransferase [Magnetospirillaceae bacterium]
MLDRYLFADWDDPPVEMDFEAAFSDIVGTAAAGVEAVRAREEAGTVPREAGDSFWTECVRLYVRAPALVNVLLNYKICVEHGLPLHPTVYYDLAEARKYNLRYPLGELERANRLYRDGVEMARAVMRLDPAVRERSGALLRSLPVPVRDFVYTGMRDKYTWRASEPAKIRALADRILAELRPSILVGAAHGSILPGLFLAEYLEVPLYFVRFSMFKRRDEAPIVSLSDELYLSGFREGTAVLFDEDVAKGTTLELFERRLASLFPNRRTASVLRHSGASIRPDYSALTWWD